MAFFQDWSGHQVGDYRLLRRLGRGSFGEVYQAEDIREHRTVALKLIKAPLTRSEDLKAFLNEARSIRLRHPHIVPLLDFGLSEQDLPYLVMDYVAGGTLRDRHPKGSRLPLSEVVKLATQLASALQYAHDHRLVHRDVKPENVLCRKDGMVLLSDFGIASVAHASSSASAYQAFGGTLPYMAPEQQAGKPRPASDQYALAIAVYEWLAGERPFQGTIPELVSQHLHVPPPSLLERVPTLPFQVEQVVFKALAKQPQERFARIADFASALQAASQTPVTSPLHMPFSVPLTAPSVSKPDKTRGDISPPAISPVPPVAPAFSPLTKPTVGEPHPQQNMSMLTAGSRLTRYMNRPDRRGLFIVGLILLVMLSVSSLFYFASGNQEMPALSVSQAATATVAAQTNVMATTAAQTYATVTDRQGVMFGFDAAHTNYNPYEQTLGPGNVSRLALLWNFATTDTITSPPTVAGGMVYMSSNDGKVYVFDADCRSNCQPLWSFATNSRINSSPAIAGGVAYVSSDNGKLYAFDATCRSNCQPLWSFTTGNFLNSSPVIADGMLYIGSGDHKLYAFDATCHMNCLPLWSFTTNGVINSSPAVADGIVYVSADLDKFYAFDATCRMDCLPIWSYATSSGAILSSPTVANGLVYVSSNDGKLYAFDASCRTGCRPLWNYFIGGHLGSSPAVAAGLVYVGSANYKLYAFDATCHADCQPLWSFATNSSAIVSSPTIANGLLYVSSNDGRLYAFNASCRSNCQPIWNFATGGFVNTSPAIANGMVYLGSDDGKLYALGE